MGHVLHATHALEEVHQHLDDMLVTVIDNCGEEFHTSKLFLTTVQKYVRVAMVTDHFEAPKIGAEHVRVVCSRSDLGLALPAVVMNSHGYSKNKASILTQMMPQIFQVHFQNSFMLLFSAELLHFI